jgi:signal transduction histidine kinase
MVTVRSGEDGGVAFLCVEDTGPGIAEAARDAFSRTARQQWRVSRKETVPDRVLTSARV